jgi:3D (Asp-Asp-Asp) domain-containing protein
MALLVAACSTPRPLPPYQKPIARTRIQTVRTTAYTHTEDDHIQYSNRNALGGTLKTGRINSAAADWSRWPAGTIFRIQETGEIYQVDDYGWALSGTNTIDLYKPSRSAMNAWGVRKVTIENLQWGDPHRSLAILKQRTKYRHIRRMADEMEERMAELERPVDSAAPVVVATTPATVIAAAPVAPPAVAAAPVANVAAVPVARAEPMPASRPVSGRAGVVVSNARPAVANNPFFGNGVQK